MPALLDLQQRQQDGKGLCTQLVANSNATLVRYHTTGEQNMLQQQQNTAPC
jgi:hypothetical protein